MSVELSGRDLCPYKGTPESSLAPSECEDTRRLQSTTRKGDLTRIPPCWLPDLGLAARRTVRNKFLSFTNHHVNSILFKQLELKQKYSPTRK